MNYYPEALDIVLNEYIDHREVLAEIAKSNPGAVVKAAKQAELNRTRNVNKRFDSTLSKDQGIATEPDVVESHPPPSKFW